MVLTRFCAELPSRFAWFAAGRWYQLRKRYIGAFSWTELDALPAPRGEEWEHAWKVADAVYYRREAPVLEGALHFHATHIKPDWARSKQPIARIGRHVFYE